MCSRASSLASSSIPAAAPAARPDLDLPRLPAGLPQRSPRLLGLLLIGLGTVVAAGWVGQWAPLVQILPGATAMVLQTAIDFVLLGLALRMPRLAEQPGRLALLPVAALLLMAALNLAQIVTGLDLVISWPALHAWNVGDNPYPGRQALTTSSCFLLSGLSLLVLGTVREPSRRMIATGRRSALLLLVIALAALAGYALRLELLVSSYVFSKMALHTAIGFVAASAALWWRWDALQVRDGAETRELRGLVTMSLVLTAAIASVTAVAVFRNEGEQALTSGLSIARRSMAEGVHTVLKLRSTRAALITTRPLLLASLRQLTATPDDPAARRKAHGYIDGFLPYGFSYIGLLGADGRELLSVGVPTAPDGLRLPLSGLNGGPAELQVHRGFLLRHRSVVDAGDGLRGVLITEQPLTELVPILTAERQVGNSARSLLCGIELVGGCASADGEPLAGMAAPPALTRRAADAIDLPASGRFADHRLSSWQALGDLGLGINLSLDSEELYAPIRRGLLWGFLLVGLFTGLAVLLLRSRVTPLVDRLARSEGRYHAVVETLAEGLMLVDGDGRVLTANRASERILGIRAEEVCGRLLSEMVISVFDEAGAPLTVERFPASRTLATNQPVTGEIMRVVRGDGSARWISVDTALADDIGDTPGTGRSVVVSFADITERRRAERAVLEAGTLRAAIVDNAPFMVISIDIHGIVTAFNPAAERLLWYTAAEMIGSPPNRIWDDQEVRNRALELGAELGREVVPGIESFIHRARHGVNEEREWTLVRKDGSRFLANMAVSALTDADGAITGFLGIAYDVTERRRREAYTQHVAHHDFLTGLPNRLLLNDRVSVAIEAAHRRGTRLAVMMLDLDHFKRVNDSLGHQVGDLLLVEVARRLQRAVRASDTVARMGGDEFVLLLPDVGDGPQALSALAAKIVETVAQPMSLHGHLLQVTPSIGVACYPDDGERGEILIKHADVALYRAKAAGRNGHRLFDRSMGHDADQRLVLEAALRRALVDNAFALHYQPQVDLDSGEILGVEALLRWTDPQLGEVSPSRFLPVAEETGLIEPIGDWVLRTAIRDAARLAGRSQRPLRMAINLSVRQFMAPGLLPRLAELLQAANLPASRLELEITEGALMRDADDTRQRLTALKTLGVTVAVDDFGVGYSSLSYLSRFELDALKIDRSFIAGVPGSAADTAVVRTIVALAASLSIRVIAEGVETPAQQALLAELRAEQAEASQTRMPFALQGYLYDPALPLDTLLARLG